MSNEHLLYLKRIKRHNIFIIIMQILLLSSFILTWEYLANKNIISSFIFSSPTKIFNTLISLYKNNNLFIHIFTTTREVLTSLLLSTIISFIIAILLYSYKTLYEILKPFINLINSLPKVALSPLIIIWLGANTKSIIFMSLLISLIVTFTTILNGFNKTDENMIKLFKIYNASKIQTLTMLIIPSSRYEIITSLRLNTSLTLIGVITGEFLSCKSGIGYLILYGTQVFNLSLVMCGIFILLLLSSIFFISINIIEKRFIK